jgi:hypothetical protein
MLTVKNKAEKLVLSMHGIKNDPNYYMSIDNAKKCALIAIDEILGMVDEESLYFDYWSEVKEEIEKM